MKKSCIKEKDDIYKRTTIRCQRVVTSTSFFLCSASIMSKLVDYILTCFIRIAKFTPADVFPLIFPG